MKTICPFDGFVKAAVLASGFGFGLFTVQPGFATTCIWTGGSGAWDNPANWSTLTVPAAGDNVYITNNATLTVTVNSDMEFASLAVGGTSGAITLNWNGGWLSGKLLLGPSAILNLVDDSNDHILDGVITNYGRINWQQSMWDFNNASRLENQSGALLDVQCDRTIVSLGANNSPKTSESRT